MLPNRSQVLSCCLLSIISFFLDLQEKRNNELRQVASSYSFHGSIIPTILVDGHESSRSFADKCKLSLCLFCFQQTDKLKYPSDHSNSSSVIKENVSSTVAAETLQNDDCQNTNTSVSIEMNSVQQNGAATHKNLQDIKKTSSIPKKFLLTVPALSEGHIEAKSSFPLNQTRKLSSISEYSTSESESNYSLRGGHTNGFKSPSDSCKKGSSNSVASENKSASVKLSLTSFSNSWKKKIIHLRALITVVVTDIFFEVFITSCILLNTTFLAIEYHDMDPQLKRVLDIGNLVSKATISCIHLFITLISFNKQYSEYGKPKQTFPFFLNPF